jgi:5'-methylthioadenosine phosphorylase
MAERIPFAIVGGSGLYALAALGEPEIRTITTPYGPPSDAIRVGRVDGRSVAFLARHGAAHSLLPSEIDYRANIWALKSLGVERLLAASAVGSLREDIHPREAVAVDQFIDRTHRRSTFFGDGLVAHVGMADPVCPELQRLLVAAGRACGATVHDGGTYLCMEGPAFSTRAESELYRSWGSAVIGMTNAQEAKLAREAEICYASLGLVTDYDCWHESEADVSVEALLDNLRANAATATEVLLRVVREVSERRTGCGCGDALRGAILTPIDEIPDAVRRRLAPVIGRHLDAGRAPG